MTVSVNQVQVMLLQRHNNHYHCDYMSLYLHGMVETFKDDIGGLLGYGSHADVSHPDEFCRKIRQKRHSKHELRTFENDDDLQTGSSAMTGMISAASAD